MNLFYYLIIILMAVPTTLFSDFSYEKPIGIKTLELKLKNPDYSVFYGELKGFQLDGTAQLIPFYYYQSQVGEGKHPLVLIQPSIIGVTFIETYTARRLAARGVSSFISLLNDDISNIERPLAGIDHFLSNASVLSSSLIDYASLLPEVDAEKIYAFGVSLGGIRTALLLGLEKRIKRGVVYVGGGNIPRIISQSQQQLIARWRKHRMEIEQLPRRMDVWNEILKNLHYDPLYFASNRKNSEVMMVMGSRDTSVPYQTQKQLRKAFGYPRAIKLRFNHLHSIYWLPALMSKLMGFLLQKKVSDERDLKIQSTEAAQKELFNEDNLSEAALLNEYFVKEKNL